MGFDTKRSSLNQRLTKLNTLDLSLVFLFFGGGMAQVRLGWVRLDYLTYMIFLGANVEFFCGLIWCEKVHIISPWNGCRHLLGTR